MHVARHDAVGISELHHPAGRGAGVTVSVVIGDYDRILQQGPFGGHQAGHCGDQSVEYPFSPCMLGEASLEAGVPKRGFTYLDAPYWISTPVTLAQEDSQYRYTAAAADDDVGDELVYAAEILPSFMRFDPATQVISGTPLRGDVNCRSDQWHPAIDRCREGGFHRVRLSVSDYTFVVYQDFVVHVLPNVSPLLAADRSFHWPTQNEITIMRNAAQLNQYHLEAQAALVAMALKKSTATVLPWTARDQPARRYARSSRTCCRRRACTRRRVKRSSRRCVRLVWRRNRRISSPRSRRRFARKSCRRRETARRSRVWWAGIRRGG